jgi:hypothetical protein
MTETRELMLLTPLTKLVVACDEISNEETKMVKMRRRRGVDCRMLIDDQMRVSIDGGETEGKIQ